MTMTFGVQLPTHGVMSRTPDGDAILFNVPADQMRPVELGVLAEDLGYHSVWFSDHLVMERVTDGAHPSNTSGKRVYQDRPVMLDIPTTMAAIAARTETLRLSPSVYIAPYRHPLITAHEFATLDVLSGGRVTLAVGVGWEEGEFRALGVPFEARGRITQECIEVYKKAWTSDWIDHQGEFFQIRDVSMEPKPVQLPHPPIWYGGMSAVAAKRAARMCDGFYPMFLDTRHRPETMKDVCDEIFREAERVGRDLTGFQLGGFSQARVLDEPLPVSARPLLTGTPEQIAEDIELFAHHGYSHLTVHFDCPSGSVSEVEEQMRRFSADVLSLTGNLMPSPL